MKIINILRACREVPYGILLNRLFKIIIAVILFFITVVNVSFAQDNYVFGLNVKVNDDPGGQAYHNVYSSGGHAIAARGIRFILLTEVIILVHPIFIFQRVRIVDRPGHRVCG